MPERTPAVSIVANEPEDVLHVPPVVGETLKLSVEPAHTADEGDVIAAGDGLTVNDIVAMQPVTGAVKVMFSVPAVTPLTNPETGSTVAYPVPAVLQLPPDGVSDNAVVKPAHTEESPVIVCAGGITVITTLSVSTALQVPLVTLSKS